MEKYTLIALILFLVNVNLWGQTDPRWTATTSSKQVTIGEEFQVEFTLTNVNGSKIVPPDFQYFKVLGRPMDSSKTQVINGSVTSARSKVYRLTAIKTGKYWIKPASVVLNGKQVFTKKIQIEVVKAKESKAKTNAEYMANLKENVFFKTELSDTVAVVGQPIVIELKLYFIPNVLDWDFMAAPPLTGFYQEENPKGAYRVSKETINGKQFNVKTLYRSIIYPQQVGTLQVGSYRVIADIESGTKGRRRGFFYSPSFTRIDLRSKSIDVRVLELPDGAPANFSGSVGKLDVRCKVDQRVATTDDAITLTLTVIGQGDTKQMQAPRFESTDSLEIYDPKLGGEKSFQTPQGIVKEKSFEYVILPKYPGSYQVSPDYSYFDSEEMIYKSLSCDTIQLRVSKGSNPIGQSTYKAPVIEDGLAGLMTAEKQSSLPDFSPMNKPMLWSMMGIPLLGMLSMVGVFYYRKNQPEINAEDLKKSQARLMALKKLETAKQALDSNQPRLFYDELSKAMHGYLEDKIGIPLSSLNESFIQEKLESLSVESSLVTRFMAVLKNCQMALFAGRTGEGDLQNSYEEAGAIIESLEDSLG